MLNFCLVCQVTVFLDASGLSVVVVRSDIEGLFHLNTTGQFQEIVSGAELSITATDSGIPPLSSTIILTVDVIQENQYQPTFEREQYMFSAVENGIIGSVVGHVNAIDRDVGSNVEYAITTLGIFPFSISGGEITVSDHLDREDVGSYTFEVTATDNGAPPSGQKSGTCTVTISVADVNDNTPMFSADSIELHFSENTAQYDPIVIMATDVDMGDNGAITQFTINQYNDIFNVESLGLQNGEVAISPKSPLDRELQEAYQFILTATDSGIPPLSSTVNISVIIDDENDNAPVIEQSHIEISLPEMTPINSEVYHISAKDEDSPKNGKYLFNQKWKCISGINIYLFNCNSD